MKTAVKNAATGIVCAGIGFFAYPALNSKQSAPVEPLSAVVQPKADAQISDSMSTSVESPLSVQKDAPTPGVVEVAEVEDPADIVEDLFQTDQEMDFAEAQGQFDQWLSTSPNVADELAMFFSSEADGEKLEAMAYLISSKEHLGLAEDIISALPFLDATNVDEYTSLLQLVPIESAEARDQALQTLPLVEEQPQLIAATINAISPDLVPPSERSVLLTQISDYASSDDPAISGAALSTLSGWSATEYGHIFEESLASGSEAKQMNALSAIGSNQFATPGIKTEVFAIMNDSNASLSLRQQAYNSMSNFQLSESEYQQFYTFGVENAMIP